MNLNHQLLYPLYNPKKSMLITVNKLYTTLQFNSKNVQNFDHIVFVTLRTRIFDHHECEPVGQDIGTENKEQHICAPNPVNGRNMTKEPNFS